MERIKRSRSSGKHCAVFGCTNNSRKRNLERTSTANGVEVKFHGFPVDKDEKRKWLSAVNRANFTPTTNSRVCSAHFVGGRKTDENSVPQLDLGYARKVVFGRRRLARDASDQVPTTKVVHSVQSTDNTDLGAALRQPVSEHMTIQSTDDTDLGATSWQPASEHVTTQPTEDTDLGATSWQPASEHVTTQPTEDTDLGATSWQPASEHVTTQPTEDTDLGATSWQPASEHVTTQPTEDTDLGATSWQPASEHVTTQPTDDTDLGATSWQPASEHVTAHPTQFTDDTDLGATTWLPAFEHVTTQPTDDTDLGAVSWQPVSEHMSTNVALMGHNYSLAQRPPSPEHATMFSMLAADDTELGATPWLPMSEHVTTHSTQSTDDTDLGATTWLPASEHVSTDDTDLLATSWLPASEHVTTDDTELGVSSLQPVSNRMDGERRRMAPDVCHQGVQWEDPCLSDHLYTTFAAPSVPTVPHGTYSLEERDILFYTGVRADVFMELVKVVPQFASSNFVMPVEQQLLLTLMKLRLGLVYGDLSRRRGDQVMADRGFSLDPEMEAKGVTLNVPAFTRGLCNLKGPFIKP
ncbi:hypothetical protein ISCGN_003482 [Ixodes scapularis]